MRFIGRLLHRSNASVLLCLALAASLLHAQTPENPIQEPTEVLRVFTELVQTDVMVFDKQGRFVNGLKKENFELKIDGKPKPISFFETVTAGSINEEAQLAAARGNPRNRPAGAPAVPLDRGRPIYFFVDDLHLGMSSTVRARKLIDHFIDTQMKQNDEVAITSASGQLGFLSQLTDNKFVLRAAVDRIKYKPYSTTDGEFPRMSEYQALLVSNRDPDVSDYFIEQVLKQNPGLTRDTAEQMVQSRASAILGYAARITSNTLLGLQSLVRSVEKIPGRKLVFFISDGFFLDLRNSDGHDHLRRITSAAARSGVVIYSIDARGLVASLSDASAESQYDPTMRLMRAGGGELSASQDALNALAEDTGGKAHFNSNALTPAVTRAIQDTSNYYLLAWSPEQSASKSNKFHRIEVRVSGRPDLTVQVKRGFFDNEPEPAVAKTKPKTTTSTKAADPALSDLQKLITALYPEREIPISLSANFVNMPDKGDLLLTTTSIPTEFLRFVPVDGKPTARVALIGLIYNDKGDVVDRFSKLVTMSANTDPGVEGNLIFPYSASLKPGIYQLRVAAREEETARAGSARSWVVIPNLAAGQMNLSSVLLGARAPKSVSNVSAEPSDFSGLDLRVSSIFSQEDFLRFLVFIYNAAPGPNGSKPDVAIQVQIVRDDQPVVTTTLKKVSVDQVEDLKRIPYAAEVPLHGLSSGRYLIQISVVDRVAKTSATQQTRFQIR
ncbi:MAG TPA: VWA domain-containing protein [Pyrinomonadaceae bacterium]